MIIIIHPSIHQSINQSINPSINQSINQAIHPSIHQSNHPSINQSIHPSLFVMVFSTSSGRTSHTIKVIQRVSQGLLPWAVVGILPTSRGETGMKWWRNWVTFGESFRVKAYMVGGNSSTSWWFSSFSWWFCVCFFGSLQIDYKVGGFNLFGENNLE